MGLIRNIGKPEQRFRYKLTLKISLILSLAFIAAAFKYFPNIETRKILRESAQELFRVEDVAQTLHEAPPPPPPQPAIMIAVPIDELLEDVFIVDTEIDFTVNMTAPPPPREEKKVVLDEEPVYFIAVEDMPEPIGGVKAIQDKIDYPEVARRAGVKGTVFVVAYLDEKGGVVKTEIARGIGAGCDEEAQDAVEKTKFTPGKQRGKPVRVKISIPVRFRLEDAVKK